MQPGNRYFPLRLGTRIFPAAGGICFSWGIPYSYYWFPRRFPRSSLGFGYIHRTHSNHPFSSQNRVGLKVYRPTPPQARGWQSAAVENARAASVHENCTGLAQIVGQLEASSRDSQSDCWANSKILGLSWDVGTSHY